MPLTVDEDEDEEQEWDVTSGVSDDGKYVCDSTRGIKEGGDVYLCNAKEDDENDTDEGIDELGSQSERR